MIAEIHHHLGIRKKEDAEVKELKKATNVNRLAEQLDKAEAIPNGKKLKGPESVADTCI